MEDTVFAALLHPQAAAAKTVSMGWFPASTLAFAAFTGYSNEVPQE
jgi:hypothetical protein